MIILNGKRFRTLAQPIYLGDGRQVKAVYENGRKVYPENEDIPKTWSWGVFVDENDLFYDMAGGKLRIRKGLTGEVVSQTEAISAFSAYPDMGFAAVRLGANSSMDWKIIFSDGTSSVVTVPTAANNYMWGFRNGIIAYATNYSAGYDLYTFSKDGTYLNRLSGRGRGFPYWMAYRIFPISGSSVGVYEYYAVGLYTQNASYWYSVRRLTPGDSSDFGFFWSQYYAPTGVSSIRNEFTYLGVHGDYLYACGQLHDPSNNTVLLPDRVLAKFSIENYSGPIELDRYYDNRQYAAPFSRYGNLRRRRVVDGIWQYDIYSPVSGTMPYHRRIGYLTAAYDFYENRRHVWYDKIYTKPL